MGREKPLARTSRASWRLVTGNPGPPSEERAVGDTKWCHFYYLYALERAGVLLHPALLHLRPRRHDRLLRRPHNAPSVTPPASEAWPVALTTLSWEHPEGIARP